MRAASVVKAARRRAGLSQRALAVRAGVAQSSIARIESGRVDPSVTRLNDLLAACGATLEVMPLLGAGIDRTQITRRLALSPRERIEELQRAASSIATVRRGRRVG